MKKNQLMLAIVGLMSSFAVYAQQPMSYPSGTSDCASFSSTEQQFASQLTPTNRAMFCNKFNQDQRNAAMQMAGQMDVMGNVMNQDQAVQKVAQDNNMTPSATTPPTQQRGQQGSSCPVK
ncbi:MAG TPA: hypothetical protein VLG49_02905 [Rhabdochlamydiaceae bacterium]|nr:hypothetical protein [Rhabdochlamydiaceae bacterium]